ncbi:hypothetical protein FRC02_008566 [Tulasnella sp. 418]|nr:hypothetical protein FRC02_008566 [Tulasnella sp. 418]
MDDSLIRNFDPLSGTSRHIMEKENVAPVDNSAGHISITSYFTRPQANGSPSKSSKKRMEALIELSGEMSIRRTDGNEPEEYTSCILSGLSPDVRSSPTRRTNVLQPINTVPRSPLSELKLYPASPSSPLRSVTFTPQHLQTPPKQTYHAIDQAVTPETSVPWRMYGLPAADFLESEATVKPTRTLPCREPTIPTHEILVEETEPASQQPLQHEVRDHPAIATSALEILVEEDEPASLQPLQHEVRDHPATATSTLEILIEEDEPASSQQLQPETRDHPTIAEEDEDVSCSNDKSSEMLTVEAPEKSKRASLNLTAIFDTHLNDNYVDLLHGDIMFLGMDKTDISIHLPGSVPNVFSHRKRPSIGTNNQLPAVDEDLDGIPLEVGSEPSHDLELSVMDEKLPDSPTSVMLPLSRPETPLLDSAIMPISEQPEEVPEKKSLSRVASPPPSSQPPQKNIPPKTAAPPRSVLRHKSSASHSSISISNALPTRPRSKFLTAALAAQAEKVTNSLRRRSSTVSVAPPPSAQKKRESLAPAAPLSKARSTPSVSVSSRPKVPPPPAAPVSRLGLPPPRAPSRTGTIGSAAGPSNPTPAGNTSKPSLLRRGSITGLNNATTTRRQSTVKPPPATSLASSISSTTSVKASAPLSRLQAAPRSHTPTLGIPRSHTPTTALPRSHTPSTGSRLLGVRPRASLRPSEATR